ncbi:hypothetical protein ABF75_13115 [Enterobacter hormaechei subsp. xiangfangensis]|nr:hypothetical protein ABF75_13115 [Enterobacter hormaechei subsp. xiangfangensis]
MLAPMKDMLLLNFLHHGTMKIEPINKYLFVLCTTLQNLHQWRLTEPYLSIVRNVYSNFPVLQVVLGIFSTKFG